MTDEEYMDLALSLAENGRGYTSPNPLVGAVVVRDGRIVGKGWHQAAGGPHAEVNALDEAGEKAKGASLYVTLEPCNHYGRTPPCTEKIIASGIARVVAAMADPNPDVTGNGAAYLEKRGIKVILGTGEKQARRQNESFIKHATTRRPFVLLKMAATLDGRIATRTGDSRWVTGEAARAYVHELRHASDAIMVGVATVRADDPSLTARLPHKTVVNPKRVILDTNLSIPEHAKLLKIEPSSDTILVSGFPAPPDRKNYFEKQGITLIEADLADGRIDLDHLMHRLGGLGITSLLIEGGARVSAAALKAGVVDKICFFYAPRILGGDDGVPMCAGPGPELMGGSIPVKDMAVRRIGEDILVEGYLRGMD